MLLPVGVIAPPGKYFPGLVGLRPDLPRRDFGSATAANNKSGIGATSVTFGEGTTPWIAPDTTFKFESMIGRGGSGTPYQTGAAYYTYTYSVVYYDANGGISGSGGNGTETFGGYGPAPPNSCSTSTNGDGTSEHTCYEYYQRYESDIPASNGQDATYFGEAFPGGVGAVATPYTITNTPIQPGAAYSVFVPSGGTLTISYCK